MLGQLHGAVVIDADLSNDESHPDYTDGATSDSESTVQSFT
jgi:hypothetical protein